MPIARRLRRLAGAALLSSTLGCDGDLPFEGDDCRARSRAGVPVAELLAAERSADATLVLWREAAAIGGGASWLSLRNSAGWRAPIELHRAPGSLRAHALSGHDVVIVAPSTTGIEATVDAGASVPGAVNVHMTRIDRDCEPHPGASFALPSFAQLALDAHGRTAVAWADEGALEARVVEPSGRGQDERVAQRQGALATPHALVALRGGGFVVAFGQRTAEADRHGRLLTAHHRAGQWQQAVEHAQDAERSALVATRDGGAALAWTSWDGTRGAVHLRLGSADGTWRQARSIHASSLPIASLRSAASRRGDRLAVVFRQGAHVQARLFDGSAAFGTLGRLAEDVELEGVGVALAIDDEGALVVARLRTGGPAELWRFDGWGVTGPVAIGDPQAHSSAILLAPAPDDRLTAVYLEAELPREGNIDAGARDGAAPGDAGDAATADEAPAPSLRIMAAELVRGRPGRAASVAGR